MLSRAYFIFFALQLSAAGLFAQTAPATLVEAQLKKLQSDPNVVWMGEIYRDYVDLDGTIRGRLEDRQKPEKLANGEMLYHHKQNISILKLQSQTLSNKPFVWDKYFFEQTAAPEVQVFADADLKKPLSKEQKKVCLTTIDTVVNFDPETFAEVITEVENELNPDHIRAYRAREIMYFDKKAGIYQTLMISIAPMYMVYNDNGEFLDYKPLYWLPVHMPQTPINPATATTVPYIKSVLMEMSFADCKQLKATQSREKCTIEMFDRLRKEKDRAYVLGAMHSDDEASGLLSPDDIGALSSSNVHSLQVNHIFSWDESTRKLSVSIYSFAPIQQRFNDKSNEFYDSWIFYLLPHKRYR